MERFIYDGNALGAKLVVGDTAAATCRFGPQIHSPMAGYFAGARSYFHADHLSSIFAPTDHMAVADCYHYGPLDENLSTTS